MPQGSPAVAVARVADPREVHATLEKILLSVPFRSSAQCKNLLTYIVRHTLAAEDSALRERMIGVQVFGRNPDYDASNDPVVRTRVAEVRKRLAQFYQSPDFAPGMIRIEIPPGSYSAVFHPTHVEPPVEAGPHRPAESAIRMIGPGSIWKNRRAMRVTSAFVLLLMGAGAWYAANSFRSNGGGEPDSSGLRTLWQGFLASNDTAFIVFSSFDGVGLTPVDSVRDAGREVNSTSEIETFKSAGDVAAVFEVTRLLTRFQKTLRLKHADLLSWDEAKESSLIFLGSPLVETPLWNVPLLHDFQFRHAGPGISPHSATGAIVNLHPGAGEAALYLGPERRPFQSDYAIVALKPGFTQNRVMLILAGISEYGTQAAAEFVTNEENVSDLLAHLGVKSGAQIPYFEAVLHIGVSDGVPIRPALVSVHRTP
ncbi:MAG: hypothetical protein WB676_11980 [Bryobacteraceae bacterium]